MSSSAPITVIIPCYNSGRTLERAIKSIQLQTIIPNQVVVVDDGSRDNTFEIMEEIRIKYSDLNIKTIKMEKNRGAATARNFAWEASTEPYIAFLDSDDSWHPEKLEVQFRFMQENPNAALTGHLTSILDPVENNQFQHIEKFSARKISKFNILYCNQFMTRTVLLRKDIPFKFVYDQRYSEDYLLWLEIVLANFETYVLQETLAYSYKGDYGVSGMTGHVYKMGYGELENFVKLHKEKKISFLTMVFSLTFSIIKFIKRIIVTNINYLRVKMKK